MVAPKVPANFTGTVVRAGTMPKTVKVRTAAQRFDKLLQKHFTYHPTYLVADLNASLRTGDVVRFAPWANPSASRRVNHVVTELVAPFGPEAREDRTPLPTAEERERYRVEKVDRQQAKWVAKLNKRGGVVASSPSDAGSSHRELALGGATKEATVVGNTSSEA